LTTSLGGTLITKGTTISYEKCCILCLNLFSDDSGKLIVVSRPNKTADLINCEGLDRMGDSPIQIFFDDNIEIDRAHIVDVRDLDTKETIPFEEANNRYIIKAEPLDIILNELYFVDRIKSVIEKHYSSYLDALF
jgi:hypothetical protein